AQSNERSSRLAGPSWASAGSCWPSRAHGSRTWAPASTTPAATLSAPSATTSASSKPSVTRSPSNPPPESARNQLLGPGSAALRRVLPPACSPWIFGSGGSPRFKSSQAHYTGVDLRKRFSLVCFDRGASMCRLRIAVSDHIPALLSSENFGSSVERAGHGQVLWRCIRAAAGASGERRSDWGTGVAHAVVLVEE